MVRLPPLRWAVPWALWVEGYFFPRTADMDPEDPQVVDILCLVCRAHWRAYCYSGRVDKRIEKFALFHRECWYRAVPLDNHRSPDMLPA
jgi:hypothetical protein